LGAAARWVLGVGGSGLLRGAARLIVQGRVLYARRLGGDAFRVLVRGWGGVVHRGGVAEGPTLHLPS